jgi:hypothetical protein
MSTGATTLSSAMDSVKHATITAARKLTSDEEDGDGRDSDEHSLQRGQKRRPPSPKPVRS